jgi:hypothetical protein
MLRRIPYDSLVTDPASSRTVTEVLESLRRDGYTADFQLVDGVLRSEGGNAPCSIDEVVVELFALLDPNTGVRGSLAAAYGPVGDPDLYDHLSRLHRRAG